MSHPKDASGNPLNFDYRKCTRCDTWHRTADGLELKLPEGAPADAERIALCRDEKECRRTTEARKESA